jgi:hypothetical protein
MVGRGMAGRGLGAAVKHTCRQTPPVGRLVRPLDPLLFDEKPAARSRSDQLGGARASLVALLTGGGDG